MQRDTRKCASWSTTHNPRHGISKPGIRHAPQISLGDVPPVPRLVDVAPDLCRFAAWLCFLRRADRIVRLLQSLGASTFLSSLQHEKMHYERKYVRSRLLATVLRRSHPETQLPQLQISGSHHGSHEELGDGLQRKAMDGFIGAWSCLNMTELCGTLWAPAKIPPTPL